MLTEEIKKSFPKKTRCKFEIRAIAGTEGRIIADRLLTALKLGGLDAGIVETAHAPREGILIESDHKHAGAALALQSALLAVKTEAQLLVHRTSQANVVVLHMGGEANAVKTPEAKSIVLVVEDDPELRGFVTMVLEREGFKVVEAGDAIQADEVWARTPNIEAMVADLWMPGLSGFDLAVLLRFRKPDLKVIFVSGLDPHPTGKEVELMANAPLLKKPFAREELVAAVRRALGKEQ